MIFAAALWLISAPAGALAGFMFAATRMREDETVLWGAAGALLPPVAAFCAVSVLVENQK